MTKKHFIALADTIREFNSTAFWGTDENGVHGKQNIPIQGDTLNVLADFCQAQNPRFNRERWLGYVQGENGKNGGAIRIRKEQPVSAS